MGKKSFDPACRTLAEHFLQDDGNPNDHYRRDELAAHIQQAVEDWFADEDTAPDSLSIDHLTSLPSEPARLIYDGARVECSRGGEWIPGTIVGTVWDDERGGLVDVDLDWPDASGDQHIWVSPDPHRIRAVANSPLHME